jgi:hypothetical protein
VEGACDHVIETSDSIKCWKVLAWLTTGAPKEGLSSISIPASLGEWKAVVFLMAGLGINYTGPRGALLEFVA